MNQKTERFEMRVEPEFGKSIDDWRRRHDRIPSRAEAIRELVGTGLAFEHMLEFALELKSIIEAAQADDRITEDEMSRFKDAVQALTNNSLQPTGFRFLRASLIPENKD